MSFKVFGKKPSGQQLQSILASANYKNGAFQNLQPTSVMADDTSTFAILKKMLNRPKTTVPSKDVPSVKTNLKNLYADQPTVVWFGHSSYLLSLRGFNILVDPVFSGFASPVKLFGKAFPGSNVYGVNDMPNIDLLILTHDHYDHLDYETIVALHPKVNSIITSLGVGAHLEYWGVPTKKITELDWWDKQIINAHCNITATPARHFSGRALIRRQTLWSSFVLQLNDYKIFIGGDSGYSQQFKLIGDTFGGFDLALIECGQYDEGWPDIHCSPEETVTAAQDLKAAVLMPVHWGKFTLANHPWNEPPQRLLPAAQKAQQAVVIPQIGQVYTIGENFKQEDWWLSD